MRALRCWPAVLLAWPAATLLCAQPAPDADYIRVQKSGCFGTCAAFSYRLFADGRYEFEGMSYTTVAGLVRGEVPAARFAQALDLLVANDFASLRVGPCSLVISDVPATTITVHARELDASLVADHGCSGYPDEARVRAVEEGLERILGLEAWHDESPAAIEREARRRRAP